MATPFVQGRLRFDPLSFTLETQCTHCAAPIRIEIDDQLDYRLLLEEADPVVFVPLVDFSKPDDPSI